MQYRIRLSQPPIRVDHLVVGLSVLVAVFDAACGGTTTGRGSSEGGGVAGAVGASTQEPKTHRAAPVECVGSRPPSVAPSPGIDTSIGIYCQYDSDCAAGLDGRCSQNGPNQWQCSYNQCHSDADCTKASPSGGGASSVCGCGLGLGNSNGCIRPGNCLVDAECKGSFCSPTFGGCGHVGVIGYYCHTSADECVDDGDCSSSSGQAFCVYSPAAGRWSCATSLCTQSP